MAKLSRLAGALIALTLAGAASSYPQEIEVPMDVQVPIFFKILSFDRNFKSRMNGEIVIGVVYQGDVRASLNAADNFTEAVKKSSTPDLEGIPVRCVQIDLSAEPDFASAAVKNKINIVYLTQLRSVDIGAISEACRTKQLLVLTGVPDYIETVAAVGLGLKGDKPQIIINLPLAKAEGVDFNSQMLKLAKVIQ